MADDDELVATDAAHEVARLGEGTKAGGDLRKNPIADGVSVSVVDVFEAVSSRPNS